MLLTGDSCLLQQTRIENRAFQFVIVFLRSRASDVHFESAAQLSLSGQFYRLPLPNSGVRSIPQLWGTSTLRVGPLAAKRTVRAHGRVLRIHDPWLARRKRRGWRFVREVAVLRDGGRSLLSQTEGAHALGIPPLQPPAAREIVEAHGSSASVFLRPEV